MAMKSATPGPHARGASGVARRPYVEGIGQVLRNVKRRLRRGARVCIVVGDRHRLYRGLAERLEFAGEMVIERQVNRRTGRRPGAFFESVVVWKLGGSRAR
jgi:uncharacterized membrane-anchored protein